MSGIETSIKKMTEEEILNTLDNSNHDNYLFVELGYVYSYLIDTRLNVFRGNNDTWAIAIERLGYNPRAGAIALDIYYYGNCLTNLENYNDEPTNYYSIYPIDADNFNQTIEGECLKPQAKFWLVRGQQLLLSHNKQDYTKANIALQETEPNEIRAEEACRLLVSQNREIFRATDDELYKSIPSDLEKILVLDEWFHKDFQLQIPPVMTDEQLLEIYEESKELPDFHQTSPADFIHSFRQQEAFNIEWNQQLWENNRPSSYETWQQIAKVITTNNPSQYKPTGKPNTHYTNWPDSGSM